MQKHAPTINLIPNRRRNFLDKFINWALGVGRVIVMLTEIIALAAFVYRFTLDHELIDLNDSVKHRKAAITFLKDSEMLYRNLQARLTLAADLESTGINPTTIFNDVVLSAPPDMIFSTIAVKDKKITIESKVQSVSSLESYIAKLRENPIIASISLDRIENKTSSAIIAVAISATLK